MNQPQRVCTLAAAGLFLLSAAFLFADQATHGAEIRIRRAAGPIKVDGDLSDPGWTDAVKITTWYETNPGDNVEPKVKNLGYLTYDDKYLYAAFDFTDPDPSKIRAPFGDRDNVPSYTDYGGIILDTRNDGKTGILLLANPRGMKRFINTYSVLRILRTLEGNTVDQDALALWTIIRVRWPLLADHLERDAEMVNAIKTGDRVTDFPDSVKSLAVTPTVRKFFQESPIELTPAVVWSCCGRQAG